MSEIAAVLQDPILPVFAIMALGYAMGAIGATSAEQARTVNAVAMSIFLPVLVFGLIANAPIAEFDGRAVLAYLLAQIVMFTLGFWAARRLFGRDPAEAVLLSFCGVFANNAFFTLPIALLIFGPGQVAPIASVITLDATVTFGGSIIALQILGLGEVTPGAVARTLLRTPALQAIALGLIVNLAGLRLADPIQTFVDFNGVAAAPVALFALGVVTSQTPLRVDGPVMLFAAIKLALFPLAVATGLMLLTGAQTDRQMFLLAAAGPAGSMAFALALLYGVRTDAIALIIILTSVLSLISLALLA